MLPAFKPVYVTFVCTTASSASHRFCPSRAPSASASNVSLNGSERYVVVVVVVGATVVVVVVGAAVVVVVVVGPAVVVVVGAAVVVVVVGSGLLKTILMSSTTVSDPAPRTENSL
jgi:hypothetical protein